MAEIVENKKIQDENSAIGLSESVNPNPVALLPFKWKIGLLFALFERFLVKKSVWPHFKGSESKSNLDYTGATIPGVSNMQRVSSHDFPVLNFVESKDVFSKFQTTSSSLAAFLGTTPTFFEKWVWFPGAEFICE